MVKANVDRILDMLSQKNSISTGELSKELKIKEEDILKSAEYLEQDGIVKIERKWPRTLITLTQKKIQLNSVPPPPSTVPQMNLGIPTAPKIMTMPQEPAPQMNTGMPPPPKIVTMPQDNKPNLAFEQTIELNAEKPQNSAQVQNLKLIDVPQFSKESIQTSQAPVQKTAASQNIEQPQVPRLNLDQNLFEVKRDEPNALITSPEENLRLAKTLMSDSDPLDASPHFDMRAPEPMKSKPFAYTEPDPSQQLSSSSIIEYPPYLRTDSERVSYLLDQISQKINSRDFSNLVSYYRTIYSLYNESDALGQNERNSFGEKIHEIFDRIKNVYMIEKAI